MTIVSTCGRGGLPSLALIGIQDPSSIFTNFANSRRGSDSAISESERFEELMNGASIAFVALRYRESQIKRPETVDRILVVVFDTETKAYEGKNALLRLDDEGRINLYANIVLAKHADGRATIEQENDRGPLGTLLGTELGSLIGMLGGPAGLAIGAVAGLLAGGTADLNDLRIGDGFIDDVTKELRPNRFAVVAEVQEESTTPVDSCMERIGGIVFRRTLSEVKHTIHEEHVAAMKADLAQMKAEWAKADADRKAKLQEKMHQLDSKIQAQLLEAKDRRDEAEWEAKAKAEDLERETEAKAAETHVSHTICE